MVCGTGIADRKKRSNSSPSLNVIQLLYIGDGGRNLNIGRNVCTLPWDDRQKFLGCIFLINVYHGHKTKLMKGKSELQCIDQRSSPTLVSWISLFVFKVAERYFVFVYKCLESSVPASARRCTPTGEWLKMKL